MAGNSNSGRKKGETMKSVFIKLPSEVLESCEAAADQAGDTMSAYLRKLITNAHPKKTT